MFKRALVSTSDKTGLLEFLMPLFKGGCEIVSTGGTSKFLRENGIQVKEVGEVTGFPEMMDGRVRTLHPKIHMGLLARSFVPEDMELLREYGVTPFDLVIVNLYPFAEAYNKGLRGGELIEQIDIGGPSLLRAAAKSHERLTVLCDPADYKTIGELARTGKIDGELRLELAAKVFAHCSYYDSIVAMALRNPDWTKSKLMTFGFKEKSKLRYGENPHQKAVWYESPVPHALSLSQAEQLQGKELSYNNILDLEAAVSVVSDFSDTACAIIKHLTPCGVAVGKTPAVAYGRAFDADSVSAFGGIVALNQRITMELAELLVGPFLECVIAPAIDPEALEVLAKKKNLRVLKLKNLVPRNSLAKDSSPEIEFKSLRGGALAQSPDHAAEWSPHWKVIGEEPSEKMKQDLVFAQRVVRHVKSNAIVVAQDLQTLGVCGGQTNRVDSVKMALERAKGRGENLVLASDAFFPFRDSIDLASQFKVKWIIQPGGSLRDQEVEAAAKENKINMVITGTRHFKH
jgi:phosphoribosylaminoimidazolecarboxamide formyltransferase/IMP cyclohydrolase